MTQAPPCEACGARCDWPRSLGICLFKNTHNLRFEFREIPW